MPSDAGAIAAVPSRFRRRDPIPPIRPAEVGDEARLAEIDAQSASGLDGSGLGALPGADIDVAAAAVVLVAGRPAVAYLRVDVLDGLAHVDRLQVLPAVARRGIGRALMEAALEWAGQHGYRAMTLTTFAESRWNDEVYRPAGFAPVQQLTPGLVEVRDWERAIGLDSLGPRVAMRRELAG
jgi:GNAT superfamily N-acetyltransferase